MSTLGLVVERARQELENDPVSEQDSGEEDGSDEDSPEMKNLLQKLQGIDAKIEDSQEKAELFRLCSNLTKKEIKKQVKAHSAEIAASSEGAPLPVWEEGDALQQAQEDEPGEGVGAENSKEKKRKRKKHNRREDDDGGHRRHHGHRSSGLAKKVRTA